MNSFLYLGDNINTLNANGSPAASPSNGLNKVVGRNISSINKCTSSVLLSNVTVSTSINSKTKIIENQTITLKRQASNSFTASPFNTKKNHLDPGSSPQLASPSLGTSRFELNAIEYGVSQDSSKTRLRFNNLNTSPSPSRAENPFSSASNGNSYNNSTSNAGQRRTRKKNYLLNPFSSNFNTSSAASTHSANSDVDSFIFNCTNEISPVKKAQVDENGAAVNNGSTADATTAAENPESKNKSTIFRVPNAPKFEFSLHKKINDIRKLSSGPFSFSLNKSSTSNSNGTANAAPLSESTTLLSTNNDNSMSVDVPDNSGVQESANKFADADADDIITKQGEYFHFKPFEEYESNDSQVANSSNFGNAPYTPNDPQANTTPNANSKYNPTMTNLAGSTTVNTINSTDNERFVNAPLLSTATTLVGALSAADGHSNRSSSAATAISADGTSGANCIINEKNQCF